MGNYENLKQSITEVIRTNGNQEITGAVLQSTLLTIISTVGANATFAGIATPATNPGTPDQNVFYIASEAGTYTNFGNIELQNGLSVLMLNGSSWVSHQMLSIDDVPTAGSNNLVKSGGVYAKIKAIKDAGYIFVGIATPTTNPGTPTQKVFYIASEAGTYTNFGSIELQDGLSILMWNGSWSSQQIFGVDNVPTAGSDNLVKSGGVYAKIKSLEDSGYVFAGVATPATNPGTPDGSVFWIASESGIYTNFNAIELQDGLSVLMWNGSWSSQQVLSIDNVPTAGSDNLVKSGGVHEELALGAVYDVSAKNPTAGTNNDGKFESLSVLLEDANLDTLIPTSVRKGGMSIKFVQSSDNKYIQARLMANSFTTDVTKWQGVDEKPTANSHNLVESGGAREFISLPSVSNEITSLFQHGFWYNGQFIDYVEPGNLRYIVSCKQKMPLSDIAIYFDTPFLGYGNYYQRMKLMFQAWDDTETELDANALIIEQTHGYFVTSGIKETILADFPTATKMTFSFAMYNSDNTLYNITDYRIYNIDKSIPNYLIQNIEGQQLTSADDFSAGFWYEGTLNSVKWSNSRSLNEPIDLVDDFCVRIDGINFEGLYMNIQIFDGYGKELLYDFWNNPIYLNSGYSEFFGFKEKVLEKYPYAKKFTIGVHNIDNAAFSNTFTLYTNKQALLHRENPVDFYSEKRISLYGDSITNEYPAYGAMYQTFISRKTRAKNVIKNGYDGATCAQIEVNGTPWNNYLSDNTRLQSLIAANPDVIIMLTGTNDFQLDSEIGNINDTVLTTLYGALRHIIETIMTALPNCVLIMCTPPPFYWQSSGRYGRMINSKGYTIRDYANAIIKISELYSIPVCDVNDKAGWLDVNEATSNFTVDGCHLSQKGYDRITSIQAGFYKTIFAKG